MENALDAGATKVQVILKNAGKGFIQVMTTGKECPREIPAWLLNVMLHPKYPAHRTCSISARWDSRGEALASIASVAEVELRTKREEDELGTYLFVADSELKIRKISIVPGEQICWLKNLFYTIPARRNF